MTLRVIPSKIFIDFSQMRHPIDSRDMVNVDSPRGLIEWEWQNSQMTEKAAQTCQNEGEEMMPFAGPSNEFQLESLFGHIIKYYVLSGRNVIFVNSDAACFKLCSLGFIQNQCVLLIRGHRKNGQALLNVYTAYIMVDVFD